MSKTEWIIEQYPQLDDEQKKEWHIRLARRYAMDFFDEEYTSAKNFRSKLALSLLKDLKVFEENEQYEYCTLYKETIDNIKYIPISKLF